MVSLKVWQPEELVAKAGKEGCPNSPRKSKLSIPPPFFLLFEPPVDWVIHTHFGKDHVFYSVTSSNAIPFHKLTLSEIRFSQLSKLF